MKLNDIVQNNKKIAFDTAPIIYFAEKNIIYFDKMLFVMQAIANGSIEGIGSVLLLAEVLVHPQQTNNLKLANQYETILTDSEHFQLIPVEVSTAWRTADLRARYNIRTPDAIHIATAIEAGCDGFLTNDLDLKKITDIPIFILDELNLD